MNPLEITHSPVSLNLHDFKMEGKPVIDQVRTLNEIGKIFMDQTSLQDMDGGQTTYSVQAWMPVAEGTPGGLFFGVSTIYPGKVGKEYFMTKGHFHNKSDRAEFYWGIQGSGMLLLMDRNRKTWAELVFPGSLHYIGSDIAHRLVNCGDTKLTVGACWPSDAGHNYDEIAFNGFSARVFVENGKPVLVLVDN